MMDAFVCLINKATDTHTEHVVLTAFPLQQWLRERASELSFKYITCLIYFLSVQTGPGTRSASFSKAI